MDNSIARYYEHFRLERLIPPELIRHLKLRYIEKGSSICQVGQPIDGLSFFVEGHAKVFMAMENGRQLLLCFYEPLQIFGDLELFEAQPRTLTEIQAVTPCICMDLKRDIVMKYLANDPAFLRQMCQSLGRKLGRVNSNSALNMLHPVENRLASYILGTASREDGASIEFTGNLTQIADFLGTSFRHIHRTLQKFCAQGLLEKDKTNYSILNETKLQKLAIGIFVIPSGMD